MVERRGSSRGRKKYLGVGWQNYFWVWLVNNFWGSMTKYFVILWQKIWAWGGNIFWEGGMVKYFWVGWQYFAITSPKNIATLSQ